MINGIQLIAYLPIINISIPQQTSEFSGFIAGIVTFDIPNIDMETTFHLETFECPEQDGIFTDLIEEDLSGETYIAGY